MALTVALATAASAAAAPAPTVARGERTSLALNGRTLAIGESGRVTTPTFAYHRVRISTVRLTGNRFGFATPARPTMIFRTSIGPMAAPLLAVSDTGEVLAGARGRGFAGPISWCCNSEGEEQVIYSDGRADARRPRAVAFDGEVARGLIVSGRSASVLERLTDGTVRREEFPLLGAGPLALGPRTLAEVDGGALLRARISTREGPIARATPAAAGPPPPGTIRGVWSDRDRVVALVRRGNRWEIYRYATDGRRRLMLRSVSRPRNVTVGRGSIAVSLGRTIWAGRGNRRLRPQRRARGAVRALAVDGVRVAWLEARGRTARVRMGRVR